MLLRATFEAAVSLTYSDLQTDAGIRDAVTAQLTWLRTALRTRCCAAVLPAGQFVSLDATTADAKGADDEDGAEDGITLQQCMELAAEYAEAPQLWQRKCEPTGSGGGSGKVKAKGKGRNGKKASKGPKQTASAVSLTGVLGPEECEGVAMVDTLQVLPVRFLWKAGSDGIDAPAPCLVAAQAYSVASIPLYADVLQAYAASARLEACATDLLAKLDTQLQDMATPICDYLIECRGGGWTAPVVRALHYCVPALVTAILVLPTTGEGGADEQAATVVRQRTALHHRYSLALTKPHFRLAQALWRPAMVPCLADPELLTNVHQYIPAPVISGGTLHMVRGPYQYYHYMQQRQNDKGWGCAYRSLQTVMSWLRLNCFTEHAVPTLREIQQCLVAMGDQPSSLIGSSQWIGSIEVGMVIQHLCNVPYRILSVSSGSEVLHQARSMARHFDEFGSPIMIGGGALAYTCIGVCYNADTAAAKLLILDPHYTGPEDMKLITAKEANLEGYRAIPVSWRGAEAFATASSYNMCLPEPAPQV